jgi:hypothetical protein
LYGLAWTLVFHVKTVQNARRDSAPAVVEPADHHDPLALDLWAKPREPVQSVLFPKATQTRAHGIVQEKTGCAWFVEAVPSESDQNALPICSFFEFGGPHADLSIVLGSGGLFGDPEARSGQVPCALATQKAVQKNPATHHNFICGKSMDEERKV